MSAKAGLIDSDKTKLRPVPIGAVRMGEGFWKARMDRNKAQGIPRLLKHLEDHGRVDAFRIVSGRKAGAQKGPYFRDSDLYKWMEGAALALQTYDDPELKSKLGEIIDEVVAAQGQDGYLNTFFSGELADQRFRNLAVEHELYCAGHLFQAAVAHYRGTGDDKLLNCACRYADYLAAHFGYDKNQGVDGYPEIEMALVELYRATGKRSYLELAEYFLSQWSFKEKQGVDGHAVRALYLASAGADYFAETGDAAYGDAVQRQWEDLVYRKLYVTGGVGSYYAKEAIGWPYDLPNEHAYTETCAAIANVMFNYRLLAITGESKYADEMERALYNGVISGVSLDGTAYFYQNPLSNFRNYQRQEWFDCTCCPTNMVRTLAAIPGYVYSTSAEGVWVHLFDNSEVDWHLADDTPFTLKVETKYPWDGKIEITIGLDAPKEFTVFVRRPGWLRQCRANWDGGKPNTKGDGYFAFKKVWTSGETISLDFEMPVTMIECNPRVRENLGQVAIQRGPIVYCVESVDNPGVSIRDLELDSEDFTQTFKPKLLGGIVVLRGEGLTVDEIDDRSPLYRPLEEFPVVIAGDTPIKLIPYFAWANRGPSEMTVWMPLHP